MPHLAEVYRRDRLFRVLDAAVRKTVVWVAGPAGIGKTSLITSFIEARTVPALWYNVDARDADVANLFHYLAMAARLAPARRKLKLPVFAPENQAGIGAFACGFFEALCAELEVPSIIVIDDYQEARSDLLDEVMREALGVVPRGISFVFISRTEAPPWLARLLASDDVALLGWSDLRLTPSEMSGLIRMRRPDLRGQRLESILPQIIELANGWAAALALLLQSGRVAQIDANDTAEFSQPLFDYFATEVLDKATPAQRDFLLRTSVAASLTANLASRLTGSADAGRILADIERRSFLTQRLGSSGAYRYHPLLRGFLERRAQTDLGPDAIRELHRRAADALLEAGQIDEAMEHFEKMPDLSARTKFLLQVAPSYVMSGRGRTVEAWIRRLPQDWVAKSGWLLYWEAMCCLGYAPTRARELLEQAYAHFESEGDAAGLYQSCAGGMQAVVHEAIDYSRVDPWLARFEELQLRGLPCPEPLEPTIATGMLTATLFRGRDGAEIRKWAERAHRLAVSSNDIAHRVASAGFLAFHFVLNENLGRAEIILEMLRESARASESSGLSTLTLLVAETLWLWARGDNRACIERVREGLAVAARSGVFVWNDYFYGVGGGAALASENVDATQEFLSIQRDAAERGGAFAVGSYAFNASWDALSRGDHVRALELAQLGCETADALVFYLPQTMSQFGLSQVYFAMGRYPEARAALERARQRAMQAGSALLLQGCDLLEADQSWDEDRERALARLRRGFAVARERGYHNMFFMGKSMMARLAARALEHGIEPAHVRTGIARHGLLPPESALRIEAWPWRYRLRAFGAFEMTCESDGSDTRGSESETGRGVPRGMPLRLLQAILAFGARGARDVQLIDALWPDAEGDAGRRVFDTTLYRLRRQFGDDDFVRLKDGRVFLDERQSWVDIWALERVLAETEKQLAQPASIITLVDMASVLLDIYRGPLLADDPSTWARSQRKYFATKFRRIAEKIGAALERGGRRKEATALYDRAREETQV